MEIEEGNLYEKIKVRGEYIIEEKIVKEDNEKDLYLKDYKLW